MRGPLDRRASVANDISAEPAFNRAIAGCCIRSTSTKPAGVNLRAAARPAVSSSVRPSTCVLPRSRRRAQSEARASTGRPPSPTTRPITALARRPP